MSFDRLDSSEHTETTALLELVEQAWNIVANSRWSPVWRASFSVGERWQAWRQANEELGFLSQVTRCWAKILRHLDRIPCSATGTNEKSNRVGFDFSEHSNGESEASLWHDLIASRLAVLATFDERAEAPVRHLAWQYAVATLKDATQIDATQRTHCGQHGATETVEAGPDAMPLIRTFFRPLGMLVLSSFLGPCYGRFVQAGRRRGVDLRMAERQVLGFEHSQLMEKLCQRVDPGWDGLTDTADSRPGPGSDRSVVATRSYPAGSWEAIDEHLRVVGAGTTLALREMAGYTAAESPTTEKSMISSLSAGTFSRAGGTDPHSATDIGYRTDQPNSPSMETPSDADGFCANGSSPGDRDAVRRHLDQAASLCRHRHSPLTVLLMEPIQQDTCTGQWGEQLQQLVQTTLRTATAELSNYVRWGTARVWAVLPGVARFEAVRLARLAQQRWESVCGQNGLPVSAIPLAIGIATSAVVSRNFSGDNLLEAAERCLAAARMLGGAAIKSIDVL